MKKVAKTHFREIYMGTLSPAEELNTPNSCAAVGTKGGFIPSEAKQQRHLKANRYYIHFSPALTSVVLLFSSSYHSKIKSLQEKALSSGEVSVRFVLPFRSLPQAGFT